MTDRMKKARGTFWIWFTRANRSARVQAMFCLAVFFCLSLAASRPAFAICTTCGCVISEHQQTKQVIDEEHDKTKAHIEAEFKSLQEWFIEVMFKKWLLPDMQLQTEQMSASGKKEVGMLGIVRAWPGVAAGEGPRCIEVIGQDELPCGGPAHGGSTTRGELQDTQLRTFATDDGYQASGIGLAGGEPCQGLVKGL